MTDEEAFESGEYWYKVVVMVPRKVGSEWINRFFDEVTERAYEVQDSFDGTNANRDWDIFCYGTPEKDDK